MSLRGAKVRRVARREWWTTITRPGFIVSTLLLPMLPLFVILLQQLVDPEAMLGGPEPARVGIVDESGQLDLDALGRSSDDEAAAPTIPGMNRLPANLPPEARRMIAEARGEGRPPDRYLPYPDEAAARKDLLAGKLTGLVVVPKGWLENGKVEAYRVRKDDGASLASPFGTRLSSVLRRALLAGRVPPAIEARVLGPTADRVEHVLAPDGAEVPEEVVGEDVRRFLVPVLSATFLMIALFAGAGYLLLGLSEEKENRVLELLLASLTPDEILTGKLLGIGGAGLLQFAIWVGLIAVPLAILAPLIGISLTQVLWATGFFLAGYAFFGALMLGVGAVADTARHAQQLSGAFTILATLPFIFNFVILQDPSGTLARVFSFIPFTAPVTVMLRLSSSAMPTWETGLALGVLVVSAWLALRGAARVFRVALLVHGSRPSLPDVWRWLRARA